MTVSTTTGDLAEDVRAARRACETASASDQLIGSRRFSPSYWLRKALLRIVLRGQRGAIGWDTDGEGKRWYYAPGGPHDPNVYENYDGDEEGDDDSHDDADVVTRPRGGGTSPGPQES